MPIIPPISLNTRSCLSANGRVAGRVYDEGRGPLRRERTAACAVGAVAWGERVVTARNRRVRTRTRPGPDSNACQDRAGRDFRNTP